MPDVLADRVGIIGFSHGGWTTLDALDEGLASRARAAAGAEHGFAAGIAFYPECTFGSWIPAYRTAAPLLILTGELDDWTPAGPCRGLAERVQAQGQPVSFKLYPGAHHAFDTFAPKTRVPEARQGRGATIAGDPAAREDSIREVAAFFARRLKDGPGEPLPRARQ
jgi:dienelactone hydrolase